MRFSSKAVLSVLAFSVCWSLQCLISALTQGGGGGQFFRLTCTVVLLVCVGSARSVSATLGLPRSQHVCFPCLHCLGSRLLCRELSEAGPGLHAFPRSKPLRFRYSGTPQRRRLGWACILCPSQVRAAQVTGCLASAVAATYRLPCPCCLGFWVYNRRSFSGGC